MTPYRGHFYGGEGEIRTRGELPHDGFQDRYLKPLGHLSTNCLLDYTRDTAIILGVVVQSHSPRHPLLHPPAERSPHI